MGTSSLVVCIGLTFFAAQLSAVTVRAEPQAIDVIVDVAPPPTSGALEGVVRLEIPGGQGVGGLSALIWLDEGLLLASDRGRLHRTQIVRDESGRIVDLKYWTTLEVPLPPGWSRDLEGLAQSDGNLVVSVEEPPYIIRFEGEVMAPRRVASYLTWEFLGYAQNKGFEALTDLDDGGWLALVETKGPSGHDLLTRDGRALVYVAADGFAPTAADREGNRVFVIERRLSLFGGWQARLTCFDVDDLDRGGLVVPLEIARLGPPDDIDNLEGLAVRASDTDLEFLLLSDDNESVLQRTLLLQYRWSGGALAGCSPGPGNQAER